MYSTLNTSAKNPAPIFSRISKSSYWLMESTASRTAVNSGELGVFCLQSSSVSSRTGDARAISQRSPSISPIHTPPTLRGERGISAMVSGEEVRWWWWWLCTEELLMWSVEVTVLMPCSVWMGTLCLWSWGAACVAGCTPGISTAGELVVVGRDILERREGERERKSGSVREGERVRSMQLQCTCTYTYNLMYMFLNERWEGRKKEASKVKQTNKAKQHSTPKAVTFPRKNELPQVGLEPTTLYTLDRALYQLSYRGSSAGMYVQVGWESKNCYSSDRIQTHACSWPYWSIDT